LLASHRSRNIAAGSELTIDRDNDKTPVVALRELANETLDMNDLRESLVVKKMHLSWRLSTVMRNRKLK